jgi:Ser/Thr protein kinase RdoA (MazF antagonist)
VAYGLGNPIDEMIMVARGEQGRVWRLDTDIGAFAIKELVIRQMEADAAADIAYQQAVLATGEVPMPRPVCTLAGEMLVDLAGHQVRAYHWVSTSLPRIGRLIRGSSAPRWLLFIGYTMRQLGR